MILLPLLPLLCMGGQRTKTVTLRYASSDFSYTLEDGKTRISSPVHRLHFGESDTLPALPGVAVSVLVAPGEYVDSFVATPDSTLQMEGISIAPCEIPLPTDGNTNPGNRSGAVFEGVYPSGVRYDGAIDADGYRLVTFTVTPFAYDGQTHTLSLTQKYTLTLSLSGHSAAHAPGQPGYQPVQASDFLRQTVASAAVNGGEMESLYSLRPRMLPTSASSQVYEYLIITDQAGYTPYNNLAKWKTRKGVRAKVLKVAEIDTLYVGDTQSERVKAAIKDYYENHGTRYVLLGGDEQHVPVQMCWTNKGNTLTTPSDMYYACLYEDWDPDGDGLAGRIDSTANEPFSMVPNLIVTRMATMEHPSQATVFTNRIIDYESNPNTTNWADNCLLAGVKLEQSFDSVGRTDVYYRGYELRDRVIAPKWHGTCTRLFDTGTDFAGDSIYDVTRYHLATEMNKGYTFMHMDTHGTKNRWCLEKNDDFYCEQVGLINNTGRTVVVTTACSTNEFDRTDARCFSQALTHRQQAGILGYFGASREGFVGGSFELSKLFFNNVFDDPYHRFGEACSKSRFELALHHTDSATISRHVALTTNPLGDPEMPIFVSRPKTMTMTQVRFDYANDSLIVRLPMDSCRVCVMTPADDGATYYCVQEPSSTIARFSGVPASFRVCVTHPGYIPFFKDASITYVQNQTLAGSTISGTKVIIGSNVTDSVPQGPVTLYGTNVINSSWGVDIHPETMIDDGATIEINPGY